MTRYRSGSRLVEEAGGRRRRRRVAADEGGGGGKNDDSENLESCKKYFCPKNLGNGLQKFVTLTWTILYLLLFYFLSSFTKVIFISCNLAMYQEKGKK